MGLLEKLEQKRDFTSTEAAIADFILNNPEDMGRLSITALAQMTYSSKAAITRMCRKLGQDGYKEFRLAFAVELEKRRFDRQEVDFNYPFVSYENAASVMRSVHLISKEALDTCYASIPPDVMERTARTLLDAERIFLYAIGDTWITACAFSNMLMKLGVFCVMPEQYSERLPVTYSATERDAALFISYSGGPMPYLKTELGVLRRAHCKTILISTLERCEGIDEFIVIPTREQTKGKAAGYYSQTAIRYILNCLYGLIYTADPKHRRRKDRAEGVEE